MILKSRQCKAEPQLRPSGNSPSVVIRYIDPNSINSQTLNNHVLPWLSLEEQERMRKFSKASLSHVFLAAHGLKRNVLAQMTGCLPSELQFEAAEQGKPLVSGPAIATDWHFNLSHTHGLVAVAASCQPVGIDVEDLSRQVPDLDIAKRSPRVPTHCSDCTQRTSTVISAVLDLKRSVSQSGRLGPVAAIGCG